MLFYIVPEIRYAIGLVEQLKLDVTIITSHNHPAIPLLRKQGLTVWCAEESGLEAPYHAHGLLVLDEVKKLILATPVDDRVLVTFKNSPQFTLHAKKLQAKIAMPSFKLNRFWEDKNRGLKELAAADIPVKSSFINLWKNFSYQDIATRFGHEKLVIQKPFGMMGNSTYFVNNIAEWEALDKKIGENPLVKLTPYLEGEPFTVNCLLLQSGQVKSSYPMFQITGDDRFTRYAGGTCGIDMTGTKTFSSRFLKELAAIVERIGTLMRASKFWGWFGIDILISNGEVVVLEINPRFTASISIFSQAQYLHCEHSFWQEYFENTKGNWQSQVPLPYTSLLVRNIGDADVVIGGELVPGIYTQKEGGLHLKKETVLVQDLVEPETYLIVAKGKGTCVHLDGELATILAFGSGTKAGKVDDNLAKVADLTRIALLG